MVHLVRGRKNVNHIVAGALVGQVFCTSPIPQLLQQNKNSSAFLELAQAKQIMDQNLFIWTSVTQKHH